MTVWNNLNDKTIGINVSNDKARSYSYAIYLETGKQGRLQLLGTVGNELLAIREARSLAHAERFDLTENGYESTRFIVVFRVKKNGLQILDSESRIGKLKWVDEEKKRILRIPIVKYCTMSYAKKVAKALDYIPMK
jgi:hypothetical protein